ncbi:MAG: response regulator transcription factor [Chloroflexi bacterium]|nr:response regulator transcription factor [Chloroflexota bacterium]
MNINPFDDPSVVGRIESKIKIILADDHPMLRAGIRHLLEREDDFEVVGEASDGDQVIRLANEIISDVVIMDIHMPKVSGLEATKRIKAIHPAIAILVLTIHDEDEYVVGLLQAGAAGYLLKTAYGEELVQAIRSIVAGEFVLHPVAGQRLLKIAAGDNFTPAKIDGAEQLTTRELQVLTLAAKGMSNRDIAGDLDIRVRTVKGHLVNIFAKMQVGSRIEAVLNALKKGLIRLD